MPYGNINVDTVTTTTPGGILGGGNASLMKNRIINGAMAINQRGSSITSNGYALDRWKITAITGSKMTVQQSSDAPTGFSNSMLITSSAATTIASGDYYDIGQLIEGFNTSDLGFGTANAKTVTVSFWAKSSLTGTFGGSLQNQASNRSYPFTYTISAANTWEYKTATIAGDTTGTWIGATNGAGMALLFGLGIGSTYTGTANAWTAGYIFPTSAVNLLATNAATLQITGVQLEVGASATGYEYENYTSLLSKCYRYYYRNKASAANQMMSAAGQCYQSTGVVVNIVFPVPMRTAPSALEQTGTAGDYSVWNAGTSNLTCTVAPIFNGASNTIGRVETSVASGLVAGHATSLISQGSANAYLGWSAEL
jgi:hypothetical protein